MLAGALVGQVAPGRRHLRRLAGLLATTVLGPAWPAAAEVRVYAAPGGAGLACTASQPCSLQGARDKVRALSSAAEVSETVVVLRGGEYRLTAPLVLGPQDGGGAGRQVRYEAAAGERPVLTGGVDITNWSLFEPSRNIWRAMANGLHTRQLFVDGRRARRARSAGNLGLVRVPSGFLAPDGTLASWQRPSDLELVGFKDWRMFRAPVAAVTGTLVTLEEPFWHNANLPGSPSVMESVAWVENAYELLDEDGEWYLDQAEGWLYYRPRPGENLTGGNPARVVAPVAEALLEVQGTLDNPVTDLSLVGLTFADTTWLAPDDGEGYCEAQAGFRIVGTYPDLGASGDYWQKTPAAVRLRAVRRVRLERCRLERLGGAAVNVEYGAREVTLRGNVIQDVASSGIQVADNYPHHPADLREVVADVTVADNSIRDTGVEYQGCVGVWAGYTDHVVIRDNQVGECPYTGISVGWGAGHYDRGGPYGYGTPTPLRATHIESNYVHDTMLRLRDGGGLYTQSEQPDSWLQGNVVRNTRTGVCLYLDEGTAFVTARDNVCQGTQSYWAMLWTESIHDNVVTANTSDKPDYLDGGLRNSIFGNTLAGDGLWPAPAVARLRSAGVSAGYRDILPAGLGRGDFDGDGRGDLVLRHAATGRDFVWRLASEEVLSKDELQRVSDLLWEIKGTADYDGDGQGDLLWRHAGDGSNYLWTLVRGLVAEQAPLPGVVGAWQMVASGDLDGDGRADVVWRHPTSGDDWAWLMNGAQVLSAGPLAAVPDVAWRVLAATDLDGDGRADLVWRHEGSGLVYVWLMDGLIVGGQGGLATMSAASWSFAGAADFDDDGRSDLLWRHNTTGQLRLWSMNGTSIVSQGSLSASVPATFAGAGVLDHDGDGHPDVLWLDTATGQLWSWRTRGLVVQRQVPLDTLGDAGLKVVTVP